MIVAMAPKPTPHEILARVADLFQTFETSDVHAFVMFIDTSSMTDVKSSGTNLGAKFVQSNPDIGKAFETFCTNLNTLKEEANISSLKEEADISSQRSDVDNVFDGSLLSNPILEVKSEIEEENPYDCDADVETDIDESVDEMGDRTLIIKKETASCSNMPEQGEDSVAAGTSKKAMKTRCNSERKEKLYVNTKDRHSMESPTDLEPLLDNFGADAEMFVEDANDDPEEPHSDPDILDGSFLNKSREVDVHEKPFNCDICGKSYKLKRSLSRHIKVHSSVDSYKCSLCTLFFEDSSKLLEHKRSKHQPHLCVHCGKSFGSKYNLERHLATHDMGTPSKIVKCQYPGCDKTFRDKTARDDHTNTHGNLRPHECITCNRRFNSYSAMKMHAKICSGKENCSICGICGVKYMEPRSLKEHIRAVHQELELKCSKCMKPIKYRPNLHRHEKKCKGAPI
ncbi:hypothetical protein DPMN_029834 [Dreissena polymorpha]|uniref:C2H2-type domain-containing protein n=1 Tax=Dreissena polymorpha TaxID=45954 RepID=A0A9D4LX61_DREPO|nr:hypothetical protein DPMN_029834 [Dreissena polymorpha]